MILLFTRFTVSYLTSLYNDRNIFHRSDDYIVITQSVVELLEIGYPLNLIKYLEMHDLFYNGLLN